MARRRWCDTDPVRGVLFPVAAVLLAMAVGPPLPAAAVPPPLPAAAVPPPRLVATAATAAAAAATTAGTAAAAAATSVAATTAAATVCAVTDPRLVGLSGLVVTRDGFVAVSDSNVDKDKIRIFFLDRACRYLRSVGYPTPAYDPEDLAVGRDGTLYVADIGDNGGTRHSIGVWRLAPGGDRPQLFRYAYPDGAHDAEALVLAADDTPVFVTKEPLRAGVYVPTAAADPSGAPVPLRQAGSFTPTATGTANGLGTLGELVVTGGANSPDRSTVALRTYGDAYEWSVPDGDVLKAITTGVPRVTALPGEAQGESIGYGPGGGEFFTVSDVESDPAGTPVLRYPAAPEPASATPASPAPAGTVTAPPPRPAGHRPTWWVLVSGLAAVGAMLAVTAAARRRRRTGR